MSVFYHEDPPNPSKGCKFLITAALKDVFSNCHVFGRRLSSPSLEEDCIPSDIEDEQEVVVSEIRSRAMEKLRRKPSILTGSFTWIYSPKTGELYITAKGEEDSGDEEDEDEDERQEFLSVASCFSCCSSAAAASMDAFFSVKTNFSRCSSLNGFNGGLDFQEFRRRSIVREFCHCEGWPFGLCRKAVLLPPLPKSPSESWLWRKGSRIVKMPRL